LVEPNVALLCGAVQLHGDGHQPERQDPGPDGLRHGPESVSGGTGPVHPLATYWVVVASLPVKKASPAKTARTVLPAFTVFFSEAAPLASVVAEPTFVPFTKKETLRPATGRLLPAARSVAWSALLRRTTDMVVPSFVIRKGAEAVSPAADAVSEYAPGCCNKVNVAVATPPAPVA